MENNQKVSKWMYFAAVLMFAAAVFQITDGNILIAAVFFGSGACFAAAASRYGKKEADHSSEKNE